MKSALFTTTLSSNLIRSVDDSGAKLMKITNLLSAVTRGFFYLQISFDNSWVKSVASRDFINRIKFRRLEW